MRRREGIYIQRTSNKPGLFSIFYATQATPGYLNIRTVVPGIYGVWEQTAMMSTTHEKLHHFSRMLFTFAGFVATPMTPEDREFWEGR
jgi:hypothetical protein